MNQSGDKMIVAKPVTKSTARENIPRRLNARPEPLKLPVTVSVEDPSDESDSGSELEDPEDDLARHLAALITPKTRKKKSGQSLSSAAVKVIRSLPKESQQSFTALVNENRLAVVSKQDLEGLRAVLLKNKAAVEMFLARRPISENMVQKGRSSGISFLPVYQNTRLGCPPHLCVLGEELMVRMAGGSLARSQFGGKAGGHQGREHPTGAHVIGRSLAPTSRRTTSRGSFGAQGGGANNETPGGSRDCSREEGKDQPASGYTIGPL